MMKKAAFILITIFITAQLFAQAAEPARYKAAITRFERFYNNNLPDSIFHDFGPELKAQLPAEKFIPSTTQLKKQLGSLVKAEFLRLEGPLAVYKATFQNGLFALNLSLNATDKYTGLALSPYVDDAAKKTAAAEGMDESTVTVKTLGGTMYGTLAVPSGVKEKIPVVLIIADAGAIDRDGNSAKLNILADTYKLIAADLAKNNIASLRYDKRLVGQSIGTTKENDLVFDDRTDDALGFMNLLKADERFSKVIVLGHGEGVLAGTLATIAAEGGISGLISAEGAGEQGDKIIFEQMKLQPSYIADGVKRIMDSLKIGKPTPKVDPAIYPILRPSIQNFVSTWCRFLPDREFKKLRVPTLIIHGSTDLQMGVKNADLLKKAKTNSTLTIIPGMNHIFREAPADRQQNQATFTKPDLPLKPEFVTAVVDFVKGLK